MKFLIFFFISVFLMSSTEIDFADIKIEKGKNKQMVYVTHGKFLDKDVNIVNFPEELSVASKEGYNISSLCDIEHINMTKISKIEAEFKDGYPTKNAKCYNKKNILFYKSEMLGHNSHEISKFDINGMLDQKKVYTENITEFTSYYDNGQILKEGSFKNHKKEGTWKEYFKDGKLKSVAEFKKDKIINIVKY